jgi:hypothetical protein
MASKPVRFHLEADQEYLSSLTWYKDRSLTAALDFENEFQRAVSAIAEAPERLANLLLSLPPLRPPPVPLQHCVLQP